MSTSMDALSSKSRCRSLFGWFVVLCSLVLGARWSCADPLPVPPLPRLAWQERSDWVSVQPAAKGDGIADDTDAIQAAFDGVRDGTTIYFPPGTYRITRPLSLVGPHVGVVVIGHGRDTVLKWDGPTGEPLWRWDGMAYSRIEGLIFDGDGRASVGLLHSNVHRFETEVSHQYLAFRGFSDAAILDDVKAHYAVSEPEFFNCLFDDCRRGVVFDRFNDYDFTFDGCFFNGCETGIECRHGNFYIRDCHFQRSRIVDISAYPEHGSSVRRCTSQESQAFVHYAHPVGPLTIQDCWVDAWKDPQAITLAGAPVTLFDCAFSRSFNGAPLSPVSSNPGQTLILANNIGPRGVPLIKDNLARLHVIALGRRRGTVRSATQDFFASSARVPSRIFDARREFGARGDGKSDDTEAIQNAIDAARAQGNDALAYVPSGTYLVSRPLRVSGSHYRFGGSGFGSRLRWSGPEGGTLLEVSSPQNVVIEHIAVGPHDAGPMKNSIDVHQMGGVGPSQITYNEVFTFGTYDRAPERKGFVFDGLGQNEVVVLTHAEGNLRVRNCGRATILANTSYEGSITVEGREDQRDGLLGFQTRLATIVNYGVELRNSYPIVMSDFYMEQAANGYRFFGSPNDPPGRATITGAKMHLISPKDAPDTSLFVEANGYHGDAFLGPLQFYTNPKTIRLQLSGDVTHLWVWGATFYNVAPQILTLGAQNQARFVACYSTQTPIFDDTSLASLRSALGDLRFLGQMDVQLNHATDVPLA